MTTVDTITSNTESDDDTTTGGTSTGGIASGGLTPAQQLHKLSPNDALQLLARLEQEGKPIPRELLNFAKYGKYPLSITHDTIEREIEYALHNFYEHRPSYLERQLKKLGGVNLNLKNASTIAITIKQLYQQVYYDVLKQGKGIELHLTQQQFAEIRPIISKIMYFHGNQTLTGAPYFMGGVPHVFFFQWGNLLGVIRYTSAPTEKALIGDLLVYFEDLEDRTFEETMQEYEKHHPTFIKTVTVPELIMPKPIAAPPTIIASNNDVVVPTLRLTPRGTSR
jgi:hypothetical protein